MVSTRPSILEPEIEIHEHESWASNRDDSILAEHARYWEEQQQHHHQQMHEMDVRGGVKPKRFFWVGGMIWRRGN